MPKTQTTTVNGVDTSELKQALGEFRQNAALGEFTWRAENEWQGASRNRSRIAGFSGMQQEVQHPRPFTLECDEPEAMLGEDRAPNPVEYLLHALAGCVTTTMVFHAAARGIRIESVQTTLEGEMDVRGFLGLADDVPRGYRNIRVTMRVVSDAPAEKLAELAKYSPVFNTVTSATPVDVNVVKA